MQITLQILGVSIRVEDDEVTPFENMAAGMDAALTLLDEVIERDNKRCNCTE
jgi:hypothetical protein